MKLQAFRHSEICKVFKTIFFTEHLRWLILEISYELSLYCIMRMMIRVSVWYVLTLQRLFHFIACVLFLSISFSFFIFFVDFTTCLAIDVSFSIFQIKHWSCSQIPYWSFEGSVASALLSIINVAGLVQFRERLSCILPPLAFLELLAADYLRETNISNCIYHLLIILGFYFVFGGQNNIDFNLISCYYWFFSKNQFSGI